jgi:hypothetical protein
MILESQPHMQMILVLNGFNKVTEIEVEGYSTCPRINFLIMFIMYIFRLSAVLF